jgi:hypothetical protein
MKEIIGFLKRTVIGVAYVIGSPVIAFVFLLFFLYGTLIFITLGIKSIYLFFTGRGVFAPFEEDLKAHTRYEYMQKVTPLAHRQPSSTPSGDATT